MDTTPDAAARAAAAAIDDREAARLAQAAHADALAEILAGMIGSGMSMTEVARAVTAAGRRMTVRTVWHAVNRKRSSNPG